MINTETLQHRDNEAVLSGLSSVKRSGYGNLTGVSTAACLAINAVVEEKTGMTNVLEVGIKRRPAQANLNAEKFQKYTVVCTLCYLR
jgi:hypothetical protein